MSLNQIPYTNVHELNLDWILAKLQDFESRLEEIEDYGDDIATLKSAVSTLETALTTLKGTTTSSLATLNARCTALENEDDKIHLSINALYSSVADDIADITNQFDAINSSITALRAYNDSSNTVVLTESKAYTLEKVKELLEYFSDPKSIYVTNPWTNSIVTIQEFIDYLYDLLHFAGLTASEFDALGLTVDDFDSLGISAEEFDNYGKWVLFFKAGYVTATELETMLSAYAKKSDLTDMATKTDLEHYATLNDVKVVNPVTGILGSIQTAINSLASLHQNGVTVDLFDSLELTASEFDALEMTAYNFDFNGLIMLYQLGIIPTPMTGITAEQWQNIVVADSGALYTTALP